MVSINACWKITANGMRDFLGSLQKLESLKLKINSGLPLSDVRSEHAMREGARIVQMVADSPWAALVSVLCLHFVPIEMDELWTVVKRMTNLKKLSVSNCEVSGSRSRVSCSKPYSKSSRPLLQSDHPPTTTILRIPG